MRRWWLTSEQARFWRDDYDRRAPGEPPCCSFAVRRHRHMRALWKQKQFDQFIEKIFSFHTAESLMRRSYRVSENGFDNLIYAIN